MLWDGRLGRRRKRRETGREMGEVGIETGQKETKMGWGREIDRETENGVQEWGPSVPACLGNGRQ